MSWEDSISWNLFKFFLQYTHWLTMNDHIRRFLGHNLIWCLQQFPFSNDIIKVSTYKNIIWRAPRGKRIETESVTFQVIPLSTDSLLLVSFLRKFLLERFRKREEYAARRQFYILELGVVLKENGATWENRLGYSLIINRGNACWGKNPGSNWPGYIT